MEMHLIVILVVFIGGNPTSNTCKTVGPVYQSTKTETQSVACPSTQPSGSITQSRTYEVWSDGSAKNYSGWSTISNTCKAVVQSRQSENQTVACPATQPSGSIIQTRSYDLWTDGTKNNYSGWSTISNSCVAIRQSIQTESRNIGCSSGQSGYIQQKRTYEVWSDGSVRNYTAWTASANTCVAPSITANPNRKEACAVGYTGQKEYQWVIKYKNVNYTVYDPNGNPVTYTLSTAYQEEQLKSGTCTLIPTQETESKDGSQEVSCDSYFGVPSGTYNGSVYKYGTYKTTYSSNTKTSDTVFTVSSIDTTACIAQITDVTQETKTENCPSGQTGNIQYYRIKATDSKGVVSYPYGNTWLMSNNNCATTETDGSTINNDTDTPEGLLSNISITSSSLQNNNTFETYLNKLSSNSWSTSDKHKLTINVDDLSSGKYDANKVGTVISKFQSIVGDNNAEIEVSLPKNIDKFVGIDGITSEDVNNKAVILKSITFDGYNATMKHLKFYKGAISEPKEQTATIKIIPSNVKASINN